MNSISNRKNIWIYLLFQTILTGLLLIVGLRLWQADLQVPLIYSGDGILFSTVTKAVGEGSLLHFRNLGAPFQLDFVDFAFAQFPDFVFLQWIQKMGVRATMAINLYWLGCILISGWLATWAFFRMGLSLGASSFFGLMFSLTPWTFFRHIGHLGYHLAYIPITCLVLIFIGLGRERELSTKELGLYALSLVLMGINNTYYAFFSCALIGFSFVYQWVQSKKAQWKLSLIALGSVISGTLIGLIPGMIYWSKNGRGFALNFKYPSEADIYAMKLRHFFQPIPNHPIKLLRKVDDVFAQAQFPLENENMSVRLGLIGSCGLFILILTAIRFVRPTAENKKPLNFLSSATVFVLFLASVGGFGSFFNTLISPQIRAYNRMGVYIAFFSLLVLGLVWKHSQRKWILQLKAGRGSFVLAGALMLFAGADQIPTYLFRNGYSLAHQQFEEEEAYVRTIESRQENPDMIFQLPFTEYFGDGQDLHKMQGYDNGRLYLHSHKTKWTWGSVTARDGGWWKKTAALPVDQMVDTALLAGFTGFSVDTFAYKDDNLVQKIKKATGQEAIWSSQKRYAFFDLGKRRAQQKEYFDSSEAELQRRKLIYPLIPAFQSGVYGEESAGGESWRWCNRKCEVWIKNGLNSVRRAKIKVQVSAAIPDSITVQTGEQKISLLSEEPREFEILIEPLSYAHIFLKSSGTRVVAPADSRKLYFRIKSFEVTEDHF